MGGGEGAWLPNMHHKSHDQGVCIRGRVCIQEGWSASGGGVCILGGLHPEEVCIEEGGLHLWGLYPEGG